MKKFLTVLLVIAVMFTFSFGSAFAASYGIDEVSKALEDEKTLQLSYMANAKTQAVNGYTFDEDGFTKIGGVNYMKPSIEAAADKVIADVEAKMNTAINTALNGTFPVDAIDKTVVSNEAAGYLTKAQMQAALEAEVETLNKTQAPLTKAFVEGKLAVDLSKYDDTEKVEAFGGLTAVQYIGKLTAEANKAISDADIKSSDADKIAGYEKAYADFKAGMANVKTKEDQSIESDEAAKNVEQAVNAYLAVGYTRVYPVVANVTSATYPMDLTAVATGDYKEFYEAKTATTKATLFGVEIGDITKATKAEVVAVNNAMYAAITDSAKVVKAYAGTDASKIANLYKDNATFLQTLRNAMDVADKYAEVKEYGEKLKGEYVYGIKQYDDAKVDAAVADAEELVYADLDKAELNTAESYLIAATEHNQLADLQAVNFEAQKFDKAVADAKAKFIDTIIVYGDDKTAEEDKVYAKELYASAADYNDIKADTCSALDVAQSYAEIDEIMAGAAEDLGGLMLAKDAADVAKAQTAYKATLANYSTLRQSLVDTTKYTATTFSDAVKDGEALIDDAVTVDGVKAAYTEAQAIIDSVKTKDELDTMAKDVVAKINALPYAAKITAADAATVQAAYEAYAEYVFTPGSDDSKITNASVLGEKLNAVIAAEAKAINENAAELTKAYKKLGFSDADKAAKVAMKADIEASVAAADALSDKVDGINDDGLFTVTSGLSADTTYLAGLVDTEGAYYDLASSMAEQALYLAVKEGATVEEMKAALDAYDKLTDKQKYYMDADAVQLAKVIEYKMGDVVETLKITASSSAKKGSITVKWTVKGDAAAADGYQVWKSTKKNSGFKKVFTTTKKSYKNTKGLKKGTRYYYKVRAYKVVDGKNIYSDWSNKAYRKAK